MDVPDDLTGQNYSTSKSGAWSIIIWYFKRKKIWNEKNKKTISLIIGLKIRYSLRDNDLIKLINYKENILIPISIFKNSSPLESLVKYLKESLGLRLNEISRLLNRDERTIWITYKNAAKKKIALDINSKVKVPLHIFSDRKLSALENLVSYLINEEKIKILDIGNILNRDSKTVWTVYNRANKKSL